MKLSQKYVMMVYKTKSFSNAAKKLYISQPSLSSMVKKHEAELGFVIFDRTKKPVDLTPEGKIYIEYLEKMNEDENEMLYRINKLSAGQYTSVEIGGKSYYSNFILPMVCGKFHHRFPDIEVNLDMGSSLYEKLEQEKLDVVFGHFCDKTKFDSEVLFEDRFIIVMRKDTPGAEKICECAMTRKEILSGKVDSDREITDYNIFKNIEFVRYGKGGSTWLYMSELFENCKFSPCRVKNSRRFDVHYDMMLYGSGAVVTSEALVSQRHEMEDHLLYFPTNVKRQMMAIYKKNRPMSVHAREFVDITKKIANLKLVR